MKKIQLTLCTLSLLALLSGCKSAPDMVTATEQPTSTASPTASPGATTVLPDATNTIDSMDPTAGMDGLNGADGVLPNATLIPESTGVTTMDKAKRVIEQIEEELERLSEVDDAEVVIAGNKAAVGIEFDDHFNELVLDWFRYIL